MEKQYIAHTSSSIRNFKSPGPAAYNIKDTIGDVPPIKMKGRINTRKDVVDPQILNLPSSFGKVPAVRIGPKTVRRTEDVTPGASYIPPPFGSDGRKISFGKIDDRAKTRSAMTPRKKKSADETPGPGPGTYNTRDTTFDPQKHSKGIKMKGQHEFNFNTGCSPGPAEYKVKYNFDSRKPSSPKVAMHIRPSTKNSESAPGYRNLGSTLGGPKYTMKARANDEIYLV